MSRFFLEIIEEEAPRLFPPDPKRKKSEKVPFNISSFTLAVFGRKDQKAWTRLKDTPYTLRFDEAERMANAVGIPLVEIVMEAKKRTRKNPMVVTPPGRTGTLGA